jgi:hypothetical protein
MFFQRFAAFLPTLLLSACLGLAPSCPAGEGQNPARSVSMPKTAREIKELMGEGYSYVEKDELLICP